MTEFQLYKKREFSDLIGDTLNFFKKYWKNYLKNYIFLNGIILLLFAGTYYLTFRDMFTNMFNPTGIQEWTKQLIEDPMSFGALFAIFFVLSIVMSVMLTAYPMVYLGLVAKNGEEEFTLSQIWKDMVPMLGRIITFGLFSLVTLIPLMVIVVVIGFVFSFIIIGIPFLILSVITFMIWAFQAMYLYVVDKTDFIEALKLGWKICFAKYWHLIGATVVLYFCIQIFTGAFTMIPSFMTLGSVVSTGSSHVDSSLGFVIGGIYTVSTLLSSILSNLVYVQQGLIFYSSKESNVNTQAFSEIESIGQNED